MTTECAAAPDISIQVDYYRGFFLLCFILKFKKKLSSPVIDHNRYLVNYLVSCVQYPVCFFKYIEKKEKYKITVR